MTRSGGQPGLYLAYTDEAHGYGNAGTDDPPAQSPLDSHPGARLRDAEPERRRLHDGRGPELVLRRGGQPARGQLHATRSSDVDGEPVASSGYGCLGFDVLSMGGAADGPQTSDGDLTGSVKFSLGSGLRHLRLRVHVRDRHAEHRPEHRPTAAATATPTSAATGEAVAFSGTDSDDAETPDDLDYTWDFDNGGAAKDASGESVSHAFDAEGTYDVKLTVTDPHGGTASDTVTVVVAGGTSGNGAPVARLTATPASPLRGQATRLSGAGSTDAETASGDLVYRWDFGDGGDRVDAEGRTVTTRFAKAGSHDVTLTVVDEAGRSDSVTQRVTVRRATACEAGRVTRQGSWRTVRNADAEGGSYCDNAGRGTGRDTLTMSFAGPQLDVWFGRAAKGGSAKVLVDGVRVGTVSFKGRSARPRLTQHAVVTGLGEGSHTVRLVVLRGRAYVEGFITLR